MVYCSDAGVYMDIIVNVFNYYVVVFVLRINKENVEESVLVSARHPYDAVASAMKKMISSGRDKYIITVDRVLLQKPL